MLPTWEVCQIRVAGSSFSKKALLYKLTAKIGILHRYVSSTRHFYVLASMHPTIASMFGDSEQSNIQVTGMVSTKTIHNVINSTFCVRDLSRSCPISSKII